MSENRIVKAENLLLASNILVLYKGYNLQIVKSSVASFLSSDFKKRKKENTLLSFLLKRFMSDRITTVPRNLEIYFHFTSIG